MSYAAAPKYIRQMLDMKTAQLDKSLVHLREHVNKYLPLLILKMNYDRDVCTGTVSVAMRRKQIFYEVNPAEAKDGNSIWQSINSPIE